MDYILHIAVFIFLYWMLAASLNLVVGYTGILSIGHAAFYGVGAYSAALMSLHFQTPFLVNIVCAVVTCISLGIIVGGPTLRLRNDDFVIASFAFQIATFNVLNNWLPVTGGPMGMAGIPPPTVLGLTVTSRWGFVALSGIFAIVVAGFLAFVTRSPLGRVLQASREDEVFAAAMGKNVARYKLLAFVIGAAIAGCVGVIYAHYIRYIDPSSFTLMESIFIIAIVVFGGAGSLWGPLIGATILVVMPEILRFVGMPVAVAANLRQTLYGIILAAFMLIRPQGIIGQYAFGKERIRR
ncbi:MAG: branched-chain amino acid ABC transporter permease [Acidobacteria bacterium]|nr:branched-chain amino acid ABC transporter permease [Acidobacteriota bacterium]